MHALKKPYYSYAKTTIKISNTEANTAKTHKTLNFYKNLVYLNI